MYKIIYINLDTNVKITEYGFKRYIDKRLAYLKTCAWAKINFVFPLCRTWSAFKKCLCRKIVAKEILDKSEEL